MADPQKRPNVILGSGADFLLERHFFSSCGCSVQLMKRTDSPQPIWMGCVMRSMTGPYAFNWASIFDGETCEFDVSEALWRLVEWDFEGREGGE